MARSSLVQLANDAWNAEKAAHLLRRAGFGLPRVLAVRLAEMTPADAVDSLLNDDFASADAPCPAFITAPESFLMRRARLAGLDDVVRQLATMEERRREREEVAQLQAWWLERMGSARHPLREKMTLFWHGHFATSAQKVRPAWHAWHLNHVLRVNALGNFRDLVINAGKSPSMLHYLDNRTSKKDSPNENWARELMELFTLGAGHYTEDDVQEAARAFTGWSCDHERFVYQEHWHDADQKTFLGRTGNFHGWDIVDIILEQPAAAEFMAKKLWRFFACDEAPEEIVTALADALRENDYELRPTLRALFLSQAFYQDDVVAAQIKSPAQLVVQLVDDLGLAKPPYAAMARACAALGQDLFYPPNVKGWDGNRAWINANTLLHRFNLPPVLTMAALEKHDPQERQAQMASMREQVREQMLDLPREERQERMRALRGGTMMDRLDAMSDAGVEVPLAEGADPAGVFDHLVFVDAAGCVASLEQRFLAMPLGDTQRAVIVDVLTEGRGPETALQPETIPRTRRRAALRLLFSTAEYQLC
jgi:uncharacterized protein (DUF1800 family)